MGSERKALSSASEGRIDHFEDPLRMQTVLSIAGPFSGEVIDADEWVISNQKLINVRSRTAQLS